MPHPRPLSIAVCVTAWKRPAYLRQVMAALATCTGIEQLPCLVSIDGGYPLRQRRMVHDLEGGPLQPRLFVHRRRLGCAGNVGFAFRTAFADPTIDAVVMLEDDTVPSPDFLQYARTLLTRYRDDEDVFSISGYHRRVHREESAGTLRRTSVGPGEPQTLLRRRWFTPSGWATWRRVYEEIGNEWFGVHWNGKDGKEAAEIPGGEAFFDYVRCDNTGSWAWPMNLYWRRGRCEIAPDLSRIQNIGAEEGMFNVSPQWHHNNHHVEIWMGNWDGPPPAELVLDESMSRQR